MASLGATAEHITMTERRAMAAERDSTDRYVAAFMEDRIGQSFDARVTGVTRFGLFVRLADLGAEGLIPIRAWAADYFHHDEKRQALVGQRTQVTYSMGAELSGEADGGRAPDRGLEFELADGSGGEPRGAESRRAAGPENGPDKARFRGKKH